MKKLTAKEALAITLKSRKEILRKDAAESLRYHGIKLNPTWEQYNTSYSQIADWIYPP